MTDYSIKKHTFYDEFKLIKDNNFMYKGTRFFESVKLLFYSFSVFRSKYIAQYKFIYAPLMKNSLFVL